MTGVDLWGVHSEKNYLLNSFTKKSAMMWLASTDSGKFASYQKAWGKRVKHHQARVNTGAQIRAVQISCRAQQRITPA